MVRVRVRLGVGVKVTIVVRFRVEVLALWSKSGLRERVRVELQPHGERHGAALVGVGARVGDVRLG